MKKAVAAVVLVGVLVALWAFTRHNDLPQVPFAKATRQTISNTLSTNGKVEPSQFVDVRVDAPGLVSALPVHAGDNVRKGQLLAQLSRPGGAEELAAAEARAAQARAELEALRAGGRGSDTAEIEGTINRLTNQREAAVRNVESLERLVKANAATRFELDQASQSVRDLDAQIAALRQRRAALVGKNDIAAAAARLQEAEASIQLARTHMAQYTIRSPLAGTLYSLPARVGAYLIAGEPVGSVGTLDPVRVRVYVDEPELGRIATGEQVRITWDALPGKEWTGTVERRPTEVVPLGTRQVGEVLCTISNPGHELVPGTNVNAFILTQVVQNALTIPKAAVRRDSGVGVFLLERATNTVRWQPVKIGASDALRVEITSGLNEGDLVAQPNDVTLKSGQAVKPVIQ
jgi:HlyD family secretion protein